MSRLLNVPQRINGGISWLMERCSKSLFYDCQFELFQLYFIDMFYFPPTSLAWWMVRNTSVPMSLRCCSYSQSEVRTRAAACSGVIAVVNKNGSQLPEKPKASLFKLQINLVC